MTGVFFLFLIFIPPPNVSGNSCNVMLAALVNYALKAYDIHEI